MSTLRPQPLCPLLCLLPRLPLLTTLVSAAKIRSLRAAGWMTLAEHEANEAEAAERQAALDKAAQAASKPKAGEK
jgi:hypothetical protein